ncbi:CHC2 zinc finger domain-containing protein [Puniceicoccaceae bacterium K14]|nr:CHC2 zinc finger domain-containing protein [Puniceicoccaceae bacterium K14]
MTTSLNKKAGNLSLATTVPDLQIDKIYEEECTNPQNETRYKPSLLRFARQEGGILMPRIPEEDLDWIKRNVDLAALVRSKNIELKPHGSKDLVGLSPFTDEKTPSFIVTPGKNLWHCMSSGKGGDAIRFLQDHDGLSFRHAAEILLEGKLNQVSNDKVQKISTVPKLESPVSFDAEDQALFGQVLDYYRKQLAKTPAAMDYLLGRGISEEAIDAFEIGFSDRTLGLRLPQKNRKDGAEIRDRLTKIGLYRETGHEHFNGCAVFPIRDDKGEIVEVYGRKISKQKSGIYHLYLPGPHRGLLNASAFDSRDVILTESVIDALTFWSVGIRNVTCIWGTEGFSDDHLKAFTTRKTRKVFFAYDADKAGDRAVERDASRLGSLGIDCFRVEFPRGHDANSYALAVKPAEKSLALLVKSAKPILSSKNENCHQIEDTCVSSSKELAANVSSLVVAEDAAKEKDPSPQANNAVKLAQLGEDCEVTIGDRVYRVRGLGRNASLEVLKINLRVMFDGLFHVDNLDLYQAKQRNAFILAAADETTLQVELLKRDLGKVLLALEELQEKRLRDDLEIESSGPKLSEDDKTKALDLLRDPKLLDRILSDFAACGVVGEETNKLAGYLAAVSRKLDRPLAIIIQSTSAAGKTSLMEAVLEMMPEEERIKYSAMTGQSLYYLGESNLKHKILAIVEEEGAEKASYALKLLQSEGELTIASTGKDDNGRLKTEEYKVEGPVMIFLTTTAVDIDEELLNRCLVLTVDESREQTEAIHSLQRDADTLEGLRRKIERNRILDTHRNAQRLLRSLHVVNPFAPRLTFRSDRTRTRRDHVKYLTLIRTIALLHQHQRKIKTEGSLEYIEVELSDIAAANKIAHEVLGRSLDELPPQTRRLLRLLDLLVKERCQKKGLDRDQCVFTRREVRGFSGWTEFQTRTHLNKLQEMEYVIAHHGGRGQRFCYELAFDGDAESEKPQLIGLLDVNGLGATTPTSSIETGASSLKDVSSSIQRAPNEHGSSWVRDGGEAASPEGSKPKSDESSKNAQAADENERAAS